jgi:MFS family permease
MVVVLRTTSGRVPWSQLPSSARRVLVGAGVEAIGTGFVLPFVVIYLHEVRHISLAAAGAIVALNGVVGLAAIPVYGVLIDRIGAKRVLLTSLALNCIGALGFAAADSVATAAAAMTFSGLGGAGFWPASQSLIGSIVPSRDRHHFFALNFVVLNLGIGLGGLAAAALVRPGHPGTYELLFVINALTFAIDAMILAPVRVPLTAPEDHPTERSSSYRALLARPAMRWLLVLQFLLILAGYAQLETGFPAYVRTLGVSPHIVGLAFAANTGAIVAGQLWVQRRTTGLRRTRAIVMVTALWVASWCVLAAGHWTAHHRAAGVLTVIFAVVFGVGEMFFAPTIPAIVNDLAPEHMRGRANAAGAFCWSVAMVLGPVFGGTLIGAGAELAWIGALIGGCVVAAAVALRLERILPATANGGPDSVVDEQRPPDLLAWQPEPTRS